MNRFCYFFGILMIMIPTLGSLPSMGNTIWSTSSGGNWNVSGTWEGGQIPLSTDDVVIRSGATVNTILGIYSSCRDLTLQSGATLIYNGSGTTTLTVNGSINNEGMIRDGTGDLTLSVYGDLFYTGTEWSNYKVSLAGGSPQVISFSPGCLFSGAYFTADGTVRTIQGATGLSFSGTAVDFNLSTLAFNDDCTLKLSGMSLSDIIITGNGNKLEMTNGATLYNSTICNTTLTDTTAVATGTNHFNGTLVIAAGAVLENFGTSHTVYIDGSVTNLGTIRNGEGNLTIHVSGNIVNDGIWDNYETDLTGSSDQELTCGENRYFSGTLFYNQNCQSKSIIALSDLEFRGMNVNFAYGSPGLVRGNVVLTEGTCLKAFGGGSAHPLTRLNLLSTGNEARLWLGWGQYLTAFSNDCLVLKLMGCVPAGSSEMYLRNEVTVLDTLINYGSTSHTFYVDGSLTNLGYIMNNAVSLDIQVTGHVIHNGLQWSNNKVTLTGSSSQSVSCAPFSDFTCAYFECNAAHPVSFLTDATFSETRINFMNSTVTMSDGVTFTVGGVNGKIMNCTVNGDFTLNSEDEAYLSSVTFNGQVNLTGTTRIYNNVVFFNEPVENNSILQNQNLSAHTLYFNSDFTNNGTVENGAGLGNMMLELKGDIINNGTWTNNSCSLNGSGDQHVRLTGDQPILSPVTLMTTPGGNNYQWFRNGSIIPGATSANLLLPQISSSQYGLYYNTSTLGESRHFTIQASLAANFSATPLTGCAPQEVQFTDNSISGYPLSTWYWEFGDGETSSDQNPLHVYQDTGTYTVALTVGDGYVSGKMTRAGYIAAHLVPATDFTATEGCLGNPTVFTDLTEDILYSTEEEIQYASSVLGFSSQYTATNWAATQALGPPDVYPLHADNVKAWASLTENSQREFLELEFDEARQVNGVIIYETLYPGSIDTVYVYNDQTDQWVQVWSGTAEPQPLVARAFEVRFPLTAFTTNAIRIAINSPAVPYWNEIDAVALVNPVATVISDQTEYLWDVGENGVTFTTKGSISYTYQNPGSHTATLTVTNNGLCTDQTSKPVYVQQPPSGGNMTGGGVIHWGESTGDITLTSYTGNILKWEKRLGTGPWSDIAHTEPVFSEEPSSMGTWYYRAQVGFGVCPSVYSTPALVMVLKPMTVSWNGSENGDWDHASNWTPAYIPDGEVDVVIPVVTPNPSPSVSGIQECNNLLIKSAALLTIPQGASLQVNGDCIIEGESRNPGR